MKYTDEMITKLTVGCAIYLGFRVFGTVQKRLAVRKIKKEIRKELDNLVREQEKGIIDVDDYVIYPA